MKIQCIMHNMPMREFAAFFAKAEEQEFEQSTADAGSSLNSVLKKNSMLLKKLGEFPQVVGRSSRKKSTTPDHELYL